MNRLFWIFTILDTVPFNEYHYTLYYYDQGDNLVRTVPPKGVHIFDQDTITLADTARQDNVNFSPVFSPHELASKYYYNTLNQVWKQYTPDADTSYFWYDRVGRLVVSQNAKQKPVDDYSYTLYDNLGRIVEAGKINNLVIMDDATSRDSTAFTSWIAGGTKSEVTATYYDETVIPISGFTQEHLRNRVSTVTFEYSFDGDTLTYWSGTHYSYDISGNVKTIIQDLRLIDFTGQHLKRIDYDYDLASGKVNKVCYQCDSVDQFIHYYEYDADNRLTQVKTSLDGFNKEQDAQYLYYNHGPLARTELGDRQVQGVDYMYNLQGWLKGVNSSVNDTMHDMGEDGLSTGSNSQFAIDAYGFSLGYFNGDYKPIGTKQPEMDYNTYSFDTCGKSLYNGNIRHSVYGLPLLNFPIIGYTYSYDQLNRLTNMDAHRGDPANWDWNLVSLAPFYHEKVQYDGNGNIVSYNRNATPTGTGYSSNAMDSLTYHYFPSSNKLGHVTDVVASGQSPVDIDSQDTLNYVYDEIGNLIADSSEGLVISWTNSGKILEVDNPDSSTHIAFMYDPMGNRILKAFENYSTGYLDYTFYIRDAQGNIMSTYKLDSAYEFKLKEQTIYGSSRLGLLKSDKLLWSNASGTIVYSNNPVNFAEGYKQYELTNHLGNVLTTLSDKKVPIDINNDSIPDYYVSEVLSQQDYYPGGMLMPGRKFTSSSYRFGFNGKENDDEVKGNGNQQDYGMRIFDPRLVRFLSVDPLFRDYPWNSTYAFAENDVIRSIDLDGLEKYFATDGSYIGISVTNKSPNSIRMATSYSTSKDGSKQYIHGFKEIKFNDSKTELNKMWKAASDNKERTGYVIFDGDKAEVSFKQLNVIGIQNEAPDPYKTGDKFEGNANQTVIGNVHTHQNEDSDIGKNELLKDGSVKKVTDKSNFDRQYEPGGDGRTAVERGARYTIGGTNVDYFSPDGKTDSKNNITTKDNLLKGNFNLPKDAFIKKDK